MFHPVDYQSGNVINIAVMTIYGIIIQYGYNFVVGLIAVNHAKAANGSCAYQNIAMGDVFFC